MLMRPNDFYDILNERRRIVIKNDVIVKQQTCGQ